MKNTFHAVVIVLCCVAAAPLRGLGGTHEVSGFTVLSNPEKYHGRYIRFAGVLSETRDGFYVYLTPWHRQIEDINNAVVVTTTAKVTESKARSLRGKAVWVAGVLVVKTAAGAIETPVRLEMQELYAADTCASCL